MHSLGMEPRDLLRALMARDGDNPNSLAGKLRNKPSQPQIYKYLEGIAKEPRRTTLAPLAKHFGVPLDAFYDSSVATSVARDLRLVAGATASEPEAVYRVELAPEYRQLLQDLEDLAPARRSKIIDQVHQAAEEAREAAAHFASREKANAYARHPKARSATTVGYGDGNRRQQALPLTTVDDPFTAQPDERESALYSQLARVPREPHGKGTGGPGGPSKKRGR